MKNFINIALLALALVASSCVGRVDDMFELSSSERIDAYTKNVFDVLQAAPNGWHAQYYASRSYGGYNVFMKFEDRENVTIASEAVTADQEGGMDANGKLITCTSHYKMEQSMGCILSFDTHNPVFHYFSEPKVSIGESNAGLVGDFEFRVSECSKDSVVLIGKKHSSRVVMYPVSTNTTWEEEYNAVKQTEAEMAARTYYVWKGDEDMKITVTTSYRCLVFEYENEEGVATREAAAFIVTKDGYKFYRPITINGLYLEGFDNGEYGIYKASNDPNIRLEAQTLPLYEQLTSSMWFITDVADLGEYAQPYWASFKTALEKAGGNNTKATLYWALIGKYQGKLGFHMQAGGDYCVIGFKMTQTDTEGKQVKMAYDDSNSNKAGKSFYTNYKLKEALRPFIGGTKTSSKTFNLEVDDDRRPTYMILTDISDPTNVITLHTEEKDYPFGDEPIDE